MHEFTILENYSSAIVFSLALCSLLYNLFLIAQIRYGQKPINKLTLRPYQLSAAYFVVQIAHEIAYYPVLERNLEEGDTKIKYRKIDFYILKAILCLRNFFLLFWLIERVFADHILYAFVAHQADLRLEELEISKEKYVKREKSIQRAYRVLKAFLALSQTAFVVCLIVFSKEVKGFMYLTPFVGLTWKILNVSAFLTLLITYLYLNIALLLMMRRKHWLEFKKHILW